MNTLLSIAAVLCIFCLPAPIVWLTRRNKILGTLGAITCCYLVGFAFSAVSLLGPGYDKGLTTTVAYVLVALSIPLILFSIDLSAVKKLTRATLIGYGLCIAAVITVAVAMFFITRGRYQGVDFPAMVVGLYTGGTPNMNAIGAAMGAPAATISAANVSDTIVGGIYFLLLISCAPRLYRFLLNKKKRPFKLSAENAAINIEAPAAKDDFVFGIARTDKRALGRLCGAFGLAVGCLAVGAVLELLLEGTVGDNLLYILLSVSVLGVALSFIPSVRHIRGQYTLGMYLVLMFSLALAMSIDWTVFLSDILPALLFFACAQAATIVLHLLLCRIAGVDGDTAVITSTAGVYGPPFIAPVAGAAGRRDLIGPGVICGAVGLAVGTLLGIGVGQLLLLFT